MLGVNERMGLKLFGSGVTTDPADPAMRVGAAGLWGPKIMALVCLL